MYKIDFFMLKKFHDCSFAFKLKFNHLYSQKKSCEIDFKTLRIDFDAVSSYLNWILSNCENKIFLIDFINLHEHVQRICISYAISFVLL